MVIVKKVGLIILSVALTASFIGCGAAVKKDADAQRVYESLFGLPAGVQIGENLKNPKSLKDAEEIVRSDNILLFDKAEAVFKEHLEKNPDDLKANAWQAQFYLVWADRASTGVVVLRGISGIMQTKVAEIKERLKSEGLDDKEKSDLQFRLDYHSSELKTTEKVISELGEVIQSKTAQAEAIVGKLIEKYPKEYEGYRVAADLYRLKKEWEKAEETMKKLEELNPDSVGLTFLKGTIALQKEREPAKAIPYFENAVEKDPGFAKAWFYLAMANMDAKNYDKALVALEKCLAASPGHHLARAAMNVLKRKAEEPKAPEAAPPAGIEAAPPAAEEQGESVPAEEGAKDE